MTRGAHWLKKMPKKGKGKGKKKGKGDKKAAGPPPPVVQEEETISEDTRSFYLIQIKVSSSHRDLQQSTVIFYAFWRGHTWLSTVQHCICGDGPIIQFDLGRGLGRVGWSS